MTAPRHFLDLDRLPAQTLRGIIDFAAAIKRGEMLAGERPLAGQTLAMIFEKPSTRTRVSFEVAMHQLGGDAVVLESAGTHLGRGETVADTARALSRYVDVIMLRTNGADKLHELAHHASVPVINGLTDVSHPCQVMADVMTFEEQRGPIAGRTVAWSGDGNNMVVSWMHAAVQFGFDFRIATPPSLRPSPAVVDWAAERGGRVSLFDRAEEAVAGADCIATDTWVSMGDEQTVATRHNLLAAYRVDETLMALAKPDAIFMHCLPAYRGEEVSEAVIDGPRSVVWDEAENRLHAQKAILYWCLVGEPDNA